MASRPRRFKEAKRAVDDLDLGPLVSTAMTRCISCTRCVRFTTEVAGITQMGQTGRGEDAEITSYLNETLVSATCRATSSTCAPLAR